MARRTRAPENERMEAPRLEPAGNVRPRGAVYRLIAGLSVIVLALLGILVVLEIVPREIFADLAVRIAAVAGILVATTVVLSYLLPRIPR